jgi:branched-chain amino acid transport system substrate-binding protein
MRKFTTCLVIVLAVTLAFTTSSWSRTRETVIKVGLNAPITGDIPKVGEGSKYAAEMWLEDIQKGRRIGRRWNEI